MPDPRNLTGLLAHVHTMECTGIRQVLGEGAKQVPGTRSHVENLDGCIVAKQARDALCEGSGSPVRSHWVGNEVILGMVL
jgi:hypothetical protein